MVLVFTGTYRQRKNIINTYENYNNYDNVFIIPYSIRVLNCENSGFFSYVIAGINHVIERARQTGRRSVISMSLIGPKTEAVDVAIREAVANNIVVVTAAGKILIHIYVYTIM